MIEFLTTLQSLQKRLENYCEQSDVKTTEFNAPNYTGMNCRI